MPASIKTTSQTRRFHSNERVEPINQKKKFSFKKFLPKPISFKKLFSPKSLVATKRRKIAVLVVFVLLIGASGAYEYYEYQLSQNPAVIYAKKVESMTSLVSNQMTVPQDEQPVIATVSNSKKLPKEPFFENAQDGDKILLYKKHKEAILFRPSTGKVITFATLDFKNVIPTPTLTTPQQTAVAGASTSAVVTIPVSEITPTIAVPTVNYIPQGKVLVAPQH